MLHAALASQPWLSASNADKDRTSATRFPTRDMLVPLLLPRSSSAHVLPSTMILLRWRGAESLSEALKGEAQTLRTLF
eukprot:COSAG01_NODE_4616_length_4876_cov_332.828972_2_plen_78_part_00